MEVLFQRLSHNGCVRIFNQKINQKKGLVISIKKLPSLFGRMGLRKRTATTGKIEVSDVIKNEIALSSYHEIVLKVRISHIPLSFTINLDRIPSEFVPRTKSTEAQLAVTVYLSVVQLTKGDYF